MQPRVRVTIRWLLVIVWVFIIFLLSNESADGSSARSDMIVEILQSLGMSGSAEALSAFVRKTAHMMMYAVLGVLVVWAFVAIRRVAVGVIARSLLIICVFAVSDELHQMFIPGRSAEIRDVIIDMVGATIGVGIAGWLLTRGRQGRFTTSLEPDKIDK